MAKIEARYRVVGTSALKDYEERGQAHIIQFDELQRAACPARSTEIGVFDRLTGFVNGLHASISHALCGSSTSRNPFSKAQTACVFSATFAFALVLVLIGA